MGVPQACDVVVIGGGPGGANTATMLARQGVRVVLFERERHPRHRVGESIIPHFWKFAALSGVDAKIAADGFIVKSGGTTTWKGNTRQMVFRDFGYKRPALHVERDRLDKIIFDHAVESGVEAFEDVTVLSADFSDSERVTVTYRVNADGAMGTIACKFVVDASGQNAVLAKQLGLRYIDSAFRFMSVYGYWKNSKYVALGGAVRPHTDIKEVAPTTYVQSLEGIGDWGWLWHIPQREETSIGLVVPIDALDGIKGVAALERYLVDTVHALPLVGRLVEDATYIPGSARVIRDYSYSTKQFAGDRFFLVGDAAAFVDPIFSIGVVLAMYSGFLCAWAIAESLRKPTTTRRNREIYDSQMRARQEIARTIALPRYTVQQSEAGEMAQTIFRYEPEAERDLFWVASSLTQRNLNVTEFTDATPDQGWVSGRLKELGALEFEPPKQ